MLRMMERIADNRITLKRLTRQRERYGPVAVESVNQDWPWLRIRYTLHEPCSTHEQCRVRIASFF